MYTQRVGELRQPVANELVQSAEHDQQEQLRAEPDFVPSTSATGTSFRLLGRRGLLQGALHVGVLLHFLDFSL